MVTAKFWRYAVIHEQEFETVDEAVRFLAWGEDDGTLSSGDPSEIRDGDRIIKGPELDALVEEAWKSF
jgi:hypothetical protein